MQVANHNIERHPSNAHERHSGSVIHSTRIECHRFDPTAGHETLVFYPDGSWVFCEESHKPIRKGLTTSQTIGTLLEKLDALLELDDELPYTQTTATSSLWHVEVYFHNVLIKRESGPVLPQAASHLAVLDQWIHSALGLTHTFFTETKCEARA